MNNISIEKLDFHDWSVKRRARMLDHMDQYIRKNIGVDSSAYFYWENHGIGNKSDKEVLEIAQDDVKFWDNLISKGENSTQKFLELPNSIKTRIIKKNLIDSGLDYDRVSIERLTHFIEDNSQCRSGARLSVGANKELFVSSNKFEIVDIQKKFLEEVSVKAIGKYEFGEYIFVIGPCSKLPERFPKDSDCIAYVNLPNIDLVIRTRRNGDIICPLGMNGSQKLKKYLNEKKIPYYKKDKLVLLCNGNEVFWVAGVGISNKIKTVDNKVTHLLKLIKKDGYYEG